MTSARVPSTAGLLYRDTRAAITALLESLNRVNTGLISALALAGVFAALLLNLPCLYPCLVRVPTLALLIGAMGLALLALRPGQMDWVLESFATLYPLHSTEAEGSADFRGYLLSRRSRIPELQRLHHHKAQQLWRSLACLVLAAALATVDIVATLLF